MWTIVVLLSMGIAAALLIISVAPVVTIAQRGDEVVITNPGLGMRGATVTYAAGGKRYTTTTDLPRGKTSIELARCTQAAASPGEEGGMVTGARLGFDWNWYSAASVRTAGVDDQK